MALVFHITFICRYTANCAWFAWLLFFLRVCETDCGILKEYFQRVVIDLWRASVWISPHMNHPFPKMQIIHVSRVVWCKRLYYFSSRTELGPKECMFSADFVVIVVVALSHISSQPIRKIAPHRHLSFVIYPAAYL